MVRQLQTQYFQMSHIQFSSISGASCHMNHVLTNILRLPISSTKIYTTQKCKSKSCTQSKRPGWLSRVVDKGKQSGKKSSQCPTSHQWCPKWHPRVRNSCHWRCTQRLQCKCGRKQRFPQIWPWTVSFTTQNSQICSQKKGTNWIEVFIVGSLPEDSMALDFAFDKFCFQWVSIWVKQHACPGLQTLQK